MNRNLTVGVLVALVLGATVWLAGPSGFDPTAVGVLILVFSIFFVVFHPKVRALLRGRAGTMRIVGVIAIGIGIAAPLVEISWPGLGLDSGVAVAIAATSFMGGVLLTGGPFVVAIWIVQTGIDALHLNTSSPVWAALELVLTLLTFLGVAAFSTFLTRGHLAARRLISGV